MKNTIIICCLFIVSLQCSAQLVSTLAGSSQGFADGTGTAAQFYLPNGVATDALGNVYVADTYNHKIRKITPEGVVSVFAGSTQGYADGAGTAAKFYNPSGVAFDNAGNLYVADLLNHKIRKITPAGVVTTLAGSIQGYVDATGVAARFRSPSGVATDTFGNVYVADYFNDKIRKITPSGVVTTLAGSVYGFANGTGTQAQFRNPSGVATDADGNVYVADYNNDRIRKITPNGVVTTLAGAGPSGGTEDGPGDVARFYHPNGVATDVSGNVYVADFEGHKIRKVTPAGMVSTLAGYGGSGYVDGIGNVVRFRYPTGVATDAANNIYVADSGNHKIRKITQELSTDTQGTITKITIYPNPVSSVFLIPVENGFVIDKIRITDILGNIILEQSQFTTAVNVENLAEGVYILEAFSGQKRLSCKFIKE